MPTKYESLSSFLDSWFHQDFDVEGDSLDEIVSSYLGSASPNEALLVQQDIQQFITEHRDCDGAFLEAYFQMQVDPLAFAPSARSFLEAIDSRISEAPGKR